MKKTSIVINSFLTTTALLSRIPLPFLYTPDFSLFPLFMPCTGILFATILGSITFAPVFMLKTPAVSAALLLMVQYLMFNLFHFDGLLDSADALLYSTTKEKRLVILKDKSAGSFALFTGALYLMVKFFLLRRGITDIISPAPRPPHGLFIFALLLASLPAGRMAGSIVPAATTPARTDGLGFLLHRYSKKLLLSGLLLSALIILGVLSLFFGSMLSLPYIAIVIAALCAAVTTGALTAWIYKQKIGGFTGDAIGMAVELGELIYLIIIVEFLTRV